MGATALLNEAEVRPPGSGFLGRLRATGPAGLASAGVIVIATFAAFFGPLLAPYSPVETNLALAWVGPVGGHLLGFDGQGRDVLSRLLAGATTSMLGPLAVVVLAMTGGTLLAVIAAWRRTTRRCSTPVTGWRHPARSSGLGRTALGVTC